MHPLIAFESPIENVKQKNRDRHLTVFHFLTALLELLGAIFGFATHSKSRERQLLPILLFGIFCRSDTSSRNWDVVQPASLIERAFPYFDRQLLPVAFIVLMN